MPPPDPLVARPPVSVSQPPVFVSQPQSQSEGAKYMGSGSSSSDRGLDEGLVLHHSSSFSIVHQNPGTSRGRHNP